MTTRKLIIGLARKLGLKWNDKHNEWEMQDSSFSFNIINSLDCRIEELQKTAKKTETILEHFGLEYVEITEENGGTKQYAKLRKLIKKGTK